MAHGHGTILFQDLTVGLSPLPAQMPAAAATQRATLFALIKIASANESSQRYSRWYLVQRQMVPMKPSAGVERGSCCSRALRTAL
jgi:hypothetical protein